MLRIFFYIFLFVLLFTAYGCKKEKKTTKKNQFENKEINAIISSIDKNLPSKEIEEKIKLAVSKTNSMLPGLKKDEKLFFQLVKDEYGEQTTSIYPITIWYTDNNIPVKIEQNVSDKPGEEEETFDYFFHKGKLWYSDQKFAKYVFSPSVKLLLWMDPYWNKNEIPEEDFKNREKSIRDNVDLLLGENSKFVRKMTDNYWHISVEEENTLKKGKYLDLMKDDIYLQVELLNRRSTKCKLRIIDIYNKTVFIRIVNDEFLTERMGSTGAHHFLAETVYTLTENDTIDFVDIDMKGGSHAVPDVYKRADFKDLKIVQ